MRPATILIVDDEQLIRWSLATRLGEDGHKVVEAETAAEAVKKFREGVDLVLLVANVVPIPLPPLRERAKDIPLFLKYCVDTFNSEFKKRVQGVAPEEKFKLERTVT